MILLKLRLWWAQRLAIFLTRRNWFPKWRARLIHKISHLWDRITETEVRSFRKKFRKACVRLDKKSRDDV